MLRNFIDKFFAIPFIYHYARWMFTLGIRYEPIKSYLDPQSDDSILDIACGVGTYTKIVGEAKYLGVDLNEEYIETANKEWGSNSRKFEVQDVLTIDQKYPKGSFNKGMMLGLIHHLPEEDALKLLKKSSEILTERLVVMDNYYSKWHLINNLVCHLDRGKYVRTVEHERMILKQYFDIEKERRYYVNSLLAHYVVFQLKPKKNLS